MTAAVTSDRRAVFVEEDRFLQLVLSVDQSFPAAFLIHAPKDSVLCTATGKGKVYIGRRIFFSIFAGKASGIPVAAAGRAVECIDDSVKQCGLARSGVTGDEVQSAVPELREVDGRLPGIGPEGGQGQAQRSHSASPPHSSAIRPFSRSSCSGFRSLPV